MRVQLVGLVSLVHYGKGNSEPKPLEVTNLYEGRGCGQGQSTQHEIK